jgi:alginate O-acetyltransferase complex protein AlgI
VSITDFWRRWHISLSTFIRDYLYIALGGNRKGVGRTYVNLVIAFFLSGLWHGAKTTFIVWGVLHGVFLVVERLMGKESFYNRLPWIPKIILTNVIVLFTWVMFRAPDIGQAWSYWTSMVGGKSAISSTSLLYAEIFHLRHVVEMGLCAIFIWQPWQAHELVNKLTPGKLIAITAIFAYAIIGMFTQSFNPFLYFQF